jgi:hypothetical protein
MSQKKTRLPFTRLSSSFEIVQPEDLNALKGGGDSDDWQGSPGSPDDPKELPEVVVTPDPEEEEPEPDPLPEPDPIDTNPDPDDPDFELPPDDDGGYNDPEEENGPSDCNLIYPNMPAGTEEHKQPMNTCSTVIFSVLNSMISGNEKNLDAVLNEIAAKEAQENGTNAIAEKIKLMNEGISKEDADAYINQHYANNDITINYANVQSSIQSGSAVYAYFDTGERENGTVIAHAVMITGVTSQGQITYYDPQLDKYVQSNDFGKFLYGTEISIDREPMVQCN